MPHSAGAQGCGRLAYCRPPSAAPDRQAQPKNAAPHGRNPVNSSSVIALDGSSASAHPISTTGCSAHRPAGRPSLRSARPAVVGGPHTHRRRRPTHRVPAGRRQDRCRPHDRRPAGVPSDRLATRGHRHPRHGARHRSASRRPPRHPCRPARHVKVVIVVGPVEVEHRALQAPAPGTTPTSPAATAPG